MDIEIIIDNEELLEIGRQAIEDTLIDFRDSRISQPFRRNGLVCCEKDGQRSDIIRMGPEQAIVIALRAILESTKRDNKEK